MYNPSVSTETWVDYCNHELISINSWYKWSVLYRFVVIAWLYHRVAIDIVDCTCILQLQRDGDSIKLVLGSFREVRFRCNVMCNEIFNEPRVNRWLEIF